MAKTSKWFVVATEGATTDGRTINRTWIEQMAANYDPKKYGARINLEHIKWRYMWNDEPHSKCYGDVVGLKTEENAEGKLQLLAQIDPTDDLIKLNKERQKIYTSIECDPNFADTGEAYLVGLAVTDNPASLGTEMLVFSAGASANPLNNRKEKAENLFTAAIETELEFEEVKEKGLSVFAKIRALFADKEKTDDERFADQTKAIELLAGQTKETLEKLTALS
ncbi:MAG: GPO family capsid scaffolding protein, partial [Haemophilus parainfluenzae]|nr:GPO family capsid scaffolding protein [Haemophilus parainfluenzae]